jgi:hypothetical protein
VFGDQRLGKDRTDRGDDIGIVGVDIDSDQAVAGCDSDTRPWTLRPSGDLLLRWLLQAVNGPTLLYASLGSEL